MRARAHLCLRFQRHSKPRDALARRTALINPNDTFSNYFGRIVLTSDYSIDEPIFFIMTIVINLLGAFTLSELGKRRLNDYSGSTLGRCLQYIVLIFNILLLGYWGYNQNLTDIDLRMTVDFYIYLFYEYIVLLLLIFVPSNKVANQYGLPNGKQRSGEYIITYKPIYSSSDDKRGKIIGIQLVYLIP